jgi:hypothetical protein
MDVARLHLIALDQQQQRIKPAQRLVGSGAGRQRRLDGGGELADVVGDGAYDGALSRAIAIVGSLDPARTADLDLRNRDKAKTAGEQLRRALAEQGCALIVAFVISFVAGLTSDVKRTRRSSEIS